MACPFVSRICYSRWFVRMVQRIFKYLSNREQDVMVGEESSSWTDVLSSVPQGSVLGPLLCVVYIIDLSELLNGKAKILRTTRNY